MVKKYLKKKSRYGNRNRLIGRSRKTGLFRRRKTNLRKPSGRRRGGY